MAVPAMVVLNAGSSSLKFALYECREDLRLVLKGSIFSLRANPRLKIVGAGGGLVQERSLGEEAVNMGTATEIVMTEIHGNSRADAVRAVGHRIVHGGREFTAPAILDGPVLGKLRGLVPLAPIHQAQNLDIVGVAARFFPEAVQVGCFDTAFHASRPYEAKSYGLPRELTASGIQSYGFHGLSYAYMASLLRERYGPASGGRVIVAHLGSGASLCAMRDGKSIATTMGFSPLDGLVMSTRCGALDPGVVLYLLQERGMPPEDVSRLLYQESGLLGISGITGDMRQLLETDSSAARQAVDFFVYRAGREIGSLAAALGGLDTLVFTAGVGENSPMIRERIGRAAEWLGVRIDDDLNVVGNHAIGLSGSPVDVLVLLTDEEMAVAREVLALLNTDGGKASQASAWKLR